MKKQVLSPTVDFRIVSFIVGLLILTIQPLTAEIYQFSDNWGKAGFTMETNKPSGLVFNYSIKTFELKSTQVNGETVKVIEMPGQFLPNKVGSPDLPSMAEYFEVPQGMEAIYKVLSYQTETYSNVNLAPTPEMNGNASSYSKDVAIYSMNKFYPNEPIAVSDIDASMAMLQVTPFHYNPIIQQLVVYRNIKIEVSFEPVNLEELPKAVLNTEPEAIHVKMTKRFSYEPTVFKYNFDEIFTEKNSSIFKEIDNNEVKIYPNPSNGNFTLNMNFEYNDIVDIKIYNSINEVVFEENNVNTDMNYIKTINLRSLSKGIYYLRIMGSETQMVSKVILQK